MTDVIWQMWVARQLLGGTELYSQINEVNPPLWFWMAVPVEAAAQALGISRQTLRTKLKDYALGDDASDDEGGEAAAT